MTLITISTVDFLDHAMMNNGLGLQMEEAQIPEESSFTGKTVMSSSLSHQFGVIIVAIKRKCGRMVFNPGVNEIFNAGDVLVVLGKKEELVRMTQDICWAVLPQEYLNSRLALVITVTPLVFQKEVQGFCRLGRARLSVGYLSCI
ncbi:MAG: cation:proton antiporter regulatory subunit [Desulforhopalus sp.]